MGFDVRNYDGYAGYIQYGTSGEQAAILAHIDVVPAIGQWIVPPYSAQIVDNRLYGRGSVDDKGPLVACLYAMKAIQESGLPVRNHLRMILGTDEETLARGIYYYLDREDPPAFGFSPDAEFPVIHAEKGTIRYLYHLPPADQDILSIHAGSRLNVVPDQAEARLAHISPEQVQALISSLNTRATITARAEGSDTIVEVQGLASHACYPAEGINEQGDIDNQGYVKNLEDLKNPLATMNEDKKSTVLEMQQASEEILNKVVSDMPKEYGKKQAIDYFLDWMDKNLILDSDTMENTDKLSNMTEVFEKNYFEGCTSCVVDGKAVATGYSKVLTRLCNKAGISAHMTIGSWKYSGSYTLVNVDFEGKQVYIDASGCKKDDLWNQRYISDTLMARNMTISDLFNDEK